MMQNGDILACRKQILDGEKDVPVCLLGDSAYPLLPHVMKEYAAGGSTIDEKFFPIVFHLHG